MVKKGSINKTFAIIVPAYNEEKNIGCFLNKINSEYKKNIIVVDDGSIDNTYSIVKQQKINVIKHKKNLGQWSALKAGFKEALNYKYDYLMTIDSDGQHDPECIKEVHNIINEKDFDVLIGSRFLDKKNKMPAYRNFGIRFFNMIIRFLYGVKVSDCTSGLRCYNKDVIINIINTLDEAQYGSLESLLTIINNNYEIREFPIEVKPPEKTTKGNIVYGYNLLKTIIINYFEH